MKESAQAAYSYVRSHQKKLGIDQKIIAKTDIHIHVPEGGTPKEGPSAGITLATSVISLLTEIPVSKKVAMSGEITLKGKVLPVGGIKEKLLAAHREGIKEVILPLDNKPDLQDLPKNVKDDMNIHFVEHMDEVLKIALTKDISEVLKKEKESLSEDNPQSPPVTH